MLKRILSIALSLLLVLSMTSIVSAEDGLDILKNGPKKHVYQEFGFEVGGDEIVLYGYVNKNGEPQYRVYGKIGNKKGFFPVSIDSERNLNVESTDPVKDSKKDLGQAKIASDKADIPQGFKKTNRKNIFSMINVFNEKEHVAYASYDGENYYYFPIARNNQPIPGAFPYDIEAMLERSKASNNNKSVKKPNEFKKGFSVDVIVFTSDGGTITLKTVGPVVDVDALSTRRGPRFGRSDNSGGSSASNNTGSKSIKAAQQVLKKLGFLQGKIDGKMGAQTQKAITAFQAKNGLVQTGALDKGTLAKLFGESAVNAQGKIVILKRLSDSKETAAARKAVQGLEAKVNVKHGKLSISEKQSFTVQVTKNPNRISNYTFALQVYGPEEYSTTLSANGGTVEHQFQTAGNYRATLYIMGPGGKVGADVKTFTVVKGSALPEDGKVTDEDFRTDRFLNMNFGGSHNKAVKQGEYANIHVKAANTVPGHTYTIQISGHNCNTIVQGTEANPNVQMLDNNAKNYTITITGYLNGVKTRSITGTFKILAANTQPSGGNGGNQLENLKEWTVTLIHQGDKPSSKENKTVKVKHGETYVVKDTSNVEENGYIYTPSWNPKSATITDNTTFVCTWTKTKKPEEKPADTPTKKPDEETTNKPEETPYYPDIPTAAPIPPAKQEN